MIYGFEACSLDTETCELRADGAVVPIEPQVFALLRVLIEHRDRLLSREELVERVWQGRHVSDAAVSSRIKSARKAVGDDGLAQRVIRTVPKLGFRFVAEVSTRRREAAELTVAEAPPMRDSAGERAERPSIAVLPFAVVGGPGPLDWMADAVPHEVIVELSRLRWLFVVARGSSFRFRGAEASIDRVREALRVRYCLTGAMEIERSAVRVTVELSDAADAGVVWSERFRAPLDEAPELRGRIARAVVSALELEIPEHEARRVAAALPSDLNAWGAYHLGLHHMYRFNAEGNARAAVLFQRALGREPGFARAKAGLSFTHFQNAFLRFSPEIQAEADLARQVAAQSIDDDPLDPFCNLVMGRAFWLSGDLDASLPWLDRAIRLNPNYAQAKYSRGWTETLLGMGLQGEQNAEMALQLSPLDPLAYAMLGVRSLSHMVRDEPPEAAYWGERAARAPGAHALIEMIAGVAHGLAGDLASARTWAESARRRQPDVTAEVFLSAFPFRDPDLRNRIAAIIARVA